MHNAEITKRHVKRLWQQLKESSLLLHSFLVEQSGDLLMEEYLPPYTSSDLHRMFSITKSFCSIAIGFLYAQGRISLDDPITGYFPEFDLSGDAHSWLKHMTIRQMLTMETCHSSTTYKVDSEKNWVESFFVTPPSHRSGQIFLYDTSSSHTLAALIKKLTGKGVLDYLREQCLDKIDFSREAYIVNDPFGSEMGGSGLMALPMDLLKVGRYCLDTVCHGNGLFADYLREAVSFQTPTIHFGQTLDEQQGYGYQFWRIREGFAMYGMGGQYVLFYPELDLIFTVTADTQNIKGGHQKILDLIYDTVIAMKDEQKTEKEKELPHKGPCSFHASFQLYENPGNFKQLSLSIEQSEGLFTLINEDATFHFPFSFETPAVSILEKYQQRIAIKAKWADSHSLYLPVQLAGECVGSIHFLISLSEKNITVWMKKIEETYFKEFQGFLEGDME